MDQRQIYINNSEYTDKKDTDLTPLDLLPGDQYVKRLIVSDEVYKKTNTFVYYIHEKLVMYKKLFF